MSSPAPNKRPRTEKEADLAGPGIGNYDELEAQLPQSYNSVLNVRETQEAIFCAKKSIEEGLCQSLNLIQVQVPLIVSEDSGVNDLLDRDGSRTPVSFHIPNDKTNAVDAQVVQAATKWKRVALKQFMMQPGEGLITDMKAVRKDYFLDHDHSAYVDQWDWEAVIEEKDRNLDYMTDVIKKIWTTLKNAQKTLFEKFPKLAEAAASNAELVLPDELHFIHAEDLLAKYPDLPRKERESAILQEHRAVFIYGIGWTLDDGMPHEKRAADYDDWITETKSKDGRPMHGLNGDILVWNPITKRRHELSSMGIRVNADTLRSQLEQTGQTDFLNYPYHKAILNNEVPLAIGGGIGQSRVYSLLLQKAHIGEVSVAVWPKKLKEICENRNIHVLY